MEIDEVPAPSAAFTQFACGHPTLREKPNSEKLSRRRDYSKQLKTRTLAPLKRKKSSLLVVDIPPPPVVVKPNVSIREIFAKKRKAVKTRKRRKTVKIKKVVKPKRSARAAPRSAPVSPKRPSPVKPKVSTPVKPRKLSLAKPKEPEPLSQLSLSAAQRKGLTNKFESSYGQKMSGGLLISSVEHRGWAE